MHRCCCPQLLPLCRLKPHTIVKCITTVVTGLLVGLLAVALGRITETTIVWKNTLLRSIVHGPGYSLQWGMFLGTAFHVGYSVLLVIIGSSLVCSGSPILHFILLQHPHCSGVIKPLSPASCPVEIGIITALVLASLICHVSHCAH